jgi:hypothetical protein
MDVIAIIFAPIGLIEVFFLGRAIKYENNKRKELISAIKATARKENLE